MPWNLSQREGKWCVVKQGESSPVPGGCHPDRASAIKHQRALYANESRMASVYDELDAQPDIIPTEPQQPEARSELVKIEIGDQALTAALVQKMDAMSERQAETERALVAALHAIGTRDSVVNVEAPSVTVEPAVWTVEAPHVIVESPTVNVEAPNVTVESPDVNVVLPERQKTITFERDPLTQQVTSADVVES
jgi:hypothetical protein